MRYQHAFAAVLSIVEGRPMPEPEPAPAPYILGVDMAAHSQSEQGWFLVNPLPAVHSIEAAQFDGMAFRALERANAMIRDGEWVWTKVEVPGEFTTGCRRRQVFP